MGRVGQWLIGLLVLALLVAAGAYVYNLGFAQGVAESGRFVQAPGAGVPVVAFWPRPWGFGFFPFFPLLFILFWFLVLRGLFWRGGWAGRCGSRSIPRRFDEWHRRAHAAEQGGPTV